MSAVAVDPRVELAERIARLKEQRRAVILAHNYQLAEVQDIADFVGDSLELSRRATQVEADVIVFCGVMFMAETAKLLNPQRTVLIPDPLAGCPMCEMAPVEAVRKRKAELPGVTVVAYVNTTAAVKAEADICCTSANAVKIVNSLPDKRILFLPDRNLGHWVQRHTDKQIILWEGYCPTHQRITVRDIRRLKGEHPNAVVVVHPECAPDVIDLADEVLSTGQMLRWARQSSAAEVIVGTEIGLIHRLKQENPAKTFYPITELTVCPNMKRITLEKVAWALEDMKHEVTVPAEVAERARRAIERMLETV
ncbi:MAG: quinolinate synthase NadA [Armatimonadota bacterium]